MTKSTESGAAVAARVDPAGPTSPVLTVESRLELAELTIVEQDNTYIVGDPAQGTFVQLPPIGVTAIAHLRAGESVAEVSAALGRADQDRAPGDATVDILDFASTLLELGFVMAIDGISASREGTRPDHGASAWLGWLAHRWLPGPPPEKISWLFSRPAWILYSLLFSGCIAAEIASPPYRPHARDFFFLSDPLASMAIVTLASVIIVSGHECFHWLAGSAEGVSARFAVSRRLYFLVFETDLTQLWSLPRRRRYGPLLAGMAFDTIALSATIVGRILIAHSVITAPSAASHLLTAVATVVSTNLAWQFCIFLRNDLYLVLSTFLGCVNLWHTTMLIMKQKAWRLDPDEQAELAAADDRSRRHARWYSWLCVVGVTGSVWYFGHIVAPAIWRVIHSFAGQLSSQPATSPRFWEALAFGALAILPLTLMLRILGRDMRNAWISRNRSARP